MQYNDLKLFLSGMVHPDRQDQLLLAATTLTQLGIYSHELAITNALALDSVSDNSTTLATVESVLMTTLLDTIYEHGIQVIEPPISVLLEILNAIYSIDNYGDPIAIVDIINAEETSEETFSEIMSLVSSMSVEDILPYLESVNPALIQRIYSIVSQAEENLLPGLSDEDDGTVSDMINDCRDRLKAFVTNRPNSLIHQQLIDGVGLALPFDSYIEQDRDALEELPGKSLAIELYGMALASNLSAVSIKPTIEEVLIEFIADNNELLQAQSMLTTGLGV